MGKRKVQKENEKKKNKNNKIVKKCFEKHIINITKKNLLKTT